MRRSLSLPACVVAGVAILAGALGACERQRTTNAAENLAQPLPKQAVLPVPDSAFHREALLLAVMQAASAQATGVDDLQAQRPLDGRQIEIRIRLGCAGPNSEAKQSGWSFDAEKKRLRVRAVPDLSLEDPLIRELVGEGAEEVEGFWLPRPWLLTAACPRTAALAAPPSEAPPAEPRAALVRKVAERQDTQQLSAPAAPASRAAKIGIAQIFTDADDRSRRRSGRAYESARDVADGEQPGSQGFNLVLSGRLRARPGGRVIHCGGGSADAPPDCIVSADIDRVWIENPEDQTVIAEWRS